ESNWCCGGAGTYGLKHPHLSEEILERKLACIKASGAQMVVTQASSCLLQIRHGIETKGWNIEVKHLAELL
ncbi:MAG: (Fe-S)-binding protein, partial [Elusimicrobia bacterium]|nr:(Fe-S)-binding protein [Elusimicrobiota bacterium]